MSDVTLTSTQLSQLNAIIATQSQLEPQNQDWTGAYALITNAIQGTGVSSRVTYFFQTAGSVNGNSANAVANVFIRTYYTTAAALQGVTLSDSQVQAVSGDIGSAIFKDIANTGVVPGDIARIVDDDISNAVTNIPGVSQPLSFATWGGSLFAESQLGYTGFYDKYFTTPQDWQIFYLASEAACAATALSMPTQADAQAVEACLGVFGAAAGYAEMQDAAATAQGIQLLINAVGAATDLFWNTLFPPANGAELSQNDLDTVDAFGASSVVNGNLVTTLNSGAGATGLLTITPDGNGSVSIDGTRTQFSPNALLNITNDTPANLTLSLAPSPTNGLAQAIEVNASTGAGSIAIAGSQAAALGLDSSISASSGLLTATGGSVGDGITDDVQLTAAGNVTASVSGPADSGAIPIEIVYGTSGALHSVVLNTSTFQATGSTSLGSFVSSATASTDAADLSASQTSTGAVLTAVNSGDDSSQFTGVPDPLSQLTSDGSGDQIYSSQGWEGNTLDFAPLTVYWGTTYYDTSPPAITDPDTGTDTGDNFSGYDNNPGTAGSPLVLSIDKGGINLVPLGQSQAHYDYAGTGVSIHTGWVGANTGVLVYLPNGPGNLSGAELVANFAVLAALGPTGGTINSSDPAFNNLEVWVNDTGGSVGSSGELYTLAQLGIASISVNAASVDITVDGNTITQIGTVTFTDGTTELIDNVSFATGTAGEAPTLQGGSSAALAFLGQYAQDLPSKAAGVAEAVSASATSGYMSTLTGTLGLAMAELAYDVAHDDSGTGRLFGYESYSQPYSATATVPSDIYFVLENWIYYDSFTTYDYSGSVVTISVAPVEAAGLSVSAALSAGAKAAAQIYQAANLQTTSGNAAAAADIDSAAIGSPLDSTAVVDAGTTQSAWEIAFSNLVTAWSDVGSAVSAVNAAQTTVNSIEAAITPTIFTPAGNYHTERFATPEDVKLAADAAADASAAADGLRNAEADVKELLGAVATAWDVSDAILAIGGTEVSGASTVVTSGGTLEIASGTSSSAGSTVNTYAILPSTSLTVESFEPSFNVLYFIAARTVSEGRDH